MMTTTNDTILTNPTKAVAEVFGFNAHYFPYLKVREIRETAKKRGLTFVQNERFVCKKCGLEQDKGYHDSGNRLIKENSNDIPYFGEKASPYLCVYCHYLGDIYLKKNQKKLLGVEYGSISNVLITKKGFKHIVATATPDNEVYDIIKNPPEEPYLLILGETKGTVTSSAFYHPVPSAGGKLIAYTFGHAEYKIYSDKIFACIKNAERIRADNRFKGITISEDILYNRKRSTEYNMWLTHKLSNHKAFMREYTEHISLFDTGTRLLAKIVLKRWQAEYKRKQNREN